MKIFSLSILSLSLCIAFIIQFFFGNIELSLYAFPVNIALLIALVGGTFVLNREKSHSIKLQNWASTQTSLLLIACIFIGCIFIALVPDWKVQQSWPFVIVIILLLNQLLLITLRYKGPQRKRFYLNHIGIFLYISSLTFGSTDMYRWKAILIQGESTDRAYDYKGIPHALGYTIKLDSFHVTFYDNNTPQTFIAKVSSGTEKQEIKVNYPWHKTWKEDIYLTNYGTLQENGKEYCVLEFITQPWKMAVHLGLILTVIGGILLLWGKKNNKKMV